MSKGVARYDGETLTYFTNEDGLGSNTVAHVVEDEDGILWFATHFGLSRFDGRSFKTYTRTDGLCHDRVSGIHIDTKGQMWIRTWGGVCKFDGTTFSAFDLPTPEVKTMLNPDTRLWITSIMEDRQGNLWFGRDGYGAAKYDGTAFTHFTTDNGLPSNNVQAILEDRQGHIWFGTRVAERDDPDPNQRVGNGGLSRYDGNEVSEFNDIEGLAQNDIYSIYEDRSGNIWIGATGVGLYRYDGEAFQLYNNTDRMDLTAQFGVQSILEDRNGTLWFGFSGGLFRLSGDAIVHVGQDGPWE
jgi:ligand-binding sensor domain-containing protein